MKSITISIEEYRKVLILRLFLVSIVGFAFLLIATQAYAQQSLKIDDFTLSEVGHNNTVNLRDYRDKKGVVIIFHSNRCPFAKFYDSRIKSLVSKYEKEGVAFLLVNPNVKAGFAEDEALALKVVADNFSPVPYLNDEKHALTMQLKATKTPEVFLLKTLEKDFSVYYSGAIDDNPQVESDVKAPYLEIAIKNMLQDKTQVIRTQRPTGCMIRRR